MEASCFCFWTRSLWRKTSLSSALRSCQRRRFCSVLSCCSGENWSKALRKSSNRLELVEGVEEATGLADEPGEVEATCDSPVATAKPSKISATKNPTIRSICPWEMKRFSLWERHLETIRFLQSLV